MLSDADVKMVDRSLGHYRTEQEIEALRESLVNRKRARRLAGKIAVARDVRLHDRVEAAAAVVAPGLAGRIHRRRAQRFWVGAGGVRVERERAAGPARRRRVRARRDREWPQGSPRRRVQRCGRVRRGRDQRGSSRRAPSARLLGHRNRRRRGYRRSCRSAGGRGHGRRSRRRRAVQGTFGRSAAHVRLLRRCAARPRPPQSCEPVVVSARPRCVRRVTSHPCGRCLPAVRARRSTGGSRSLRRLAAHRISAHVAVGVAVAREVEAAASTSKRRRQDDLQRGSGRAVGAVTAGPRRRNRRGGRAARASEGLRRACWTRSPACRRVGLLLVGDGGQRRALEERARASAWPTGCG